MKQDRDAAYRRLLQLRVPGLIPPAPSSAQRRLLVRPFDQSLVYFNEHERLYCLSLELLNRGSSGVCIDTVVEFEPPWAEPTFYFLEEPRKGERYRPALGRESYCPEEVLNHLVGTRLPPDHPPVRGLLLASSFTPLSEGSLRHGQLYEAILSLYDTNGVMSRCTVPVLAQRAQVCQPVAAPACGRLWQLSQTPEFPRVEQISPLMTESHGEPLAEAQGAGGETTREL